jgi:hypothetical protein
MLLKTSDPDSEIAVNHAIVWREKKVNPQAKEVARLMR